MSHNRSKPILKSRDMKVRLIRSAVGLACGLLAGCASMNGLTPQATARDANGLASARALSGAKVDDAAWPSTDWWKAFHDPQLDGLMVEALADSPTLNIAAARTRKALALARASQSALSPRVDASASSTRERFSEHGLIPPPFGGTTQTLSDLQLSLSWEIDFWRKNRAAYEAALGAARAADVDAYAARLALSTNIAGAYVQLSRAYLQRQVAKQTLASRQQIAALTRDRNAAGIDSRLEVKQSEAAVPTTREEIVALDERIAPARNTIAALMGAGPDRGLAIARPTATALTQVVLPSNVPAELIGRRPDIVAQRWRVEAASKDIASQKGAFYPNVNLLAFVGVQSLVGVNLLSAASRTLGVAPAVTLPIFDAGRLRAELATRDADYDIAVEQYNQSLANAMREVVDQLVSFKSLDEQRKQQRIASVTTREAYDIALLRYREGIGNYLQVLSAEQPMLAQQALEADLGARSLALSINLVRALGGGFQPKQSDTTHALMTLGQPR
jgi:NodT family efflux transporter outer membrane factor (OMF) lipoprotein